MLSLNQLTEVMKVANKKREKFREMEHRFYHCCKKCSQAIGVFEENQETYKVVAMMCLDQVGIPVKTDTEKESTMLEFIRFFDNPRAAIKIPDRIVELTKEHMDDKEFLIDAVHNGRVKHSTVEMTKKKKADLLEVLMDPGKNNKKEDGDDPTLFFSINDMDQLLEGDDIIDMEEECEGDEDDVNAKGYDDLYDKKQKELYKKIETGMITVVRLHEMCNDLGIGDYFELILSATEFPCVICDLSILYEFRACFFDLINMSRMAASKVNLNRIKKPGKLFSKAIKNKTNAGCKPLVKGQFLGEKTELEITKRLDEVELTPKQLVDYSIFKCLGGGEDMMKTMAQLDKNNKMEDYGYNFFAEEISPPVLLRCMEGEWLDKFPFMRSIIDRIKDVALSHALPRKRIFCYINPRIMACECNIYETVRSRCLLGVKISLVNTMLKVMKRSQTKTILNQVSSICKEHGIAYEICNIHINKTMKEDKKIIKERLARKRSHPN